MALAKEQIADGETREAQLSILHALEAYERSEDAQPTGLIDAYLALGDAYQGGGEHELALGAYLEARGISRREFGLFDLGLVDILRKMADSAVALGDSEQAIALHREVIDLVIRAMVHAPSKRSKRRAILPTGLAGMGTIAKPRPDTISRAGSPGPFPSKKHRTPCAFSINLPTAVSVQNATLRTATPLGNPRRSSPPYVGSSRMC